MTNSTDASTTSNLPPSDNPFSLTGEVQPVAALSAREQERMFRIIGDNFTGTTRQRFESDLAEKEWVILLREQNGTIQGFSTLMQLESRLGSEQVTAFFSGDTIIQRDFWGQTALPRIWSRHVFRLAAAMTGRKVYWFLICSGYKTYRFLPVFFREFFPRYDRSTPVEIRQLLNTLGSFKYPSEYDAASGVVRFSEPSPLKEGIADITARHMKDPHIAFFQEANPGHVRGDELVCITEISPANVTPAGRRMLGEEESAA